MSQLAHTIRHLQRLNREDRINYLKQAVRHYPERSIMGKELRAMLQENVTRQLRQEVRGTQ